LAEGLNFPINLQVLLLTTDINDALHPIQENTIVTKRLKLASMQSKRVALIAATRFQGKT